VPVTISEFLEKSPPAETLPRLAPGSWIAHNFDTWIGEEEENKAWDYLTEARQMIDARQSTLSPTVLEQVMTELYIAEGSDWFWWYGLDQGSGIDESFDAAFRGTLTRIYTLMDEEPPQYLELPIVAVAGAEPSRAIRGRLDIKSDGLISRPDEWDPAGFIDDIEGGVMQQAGGDMLAGLYYGFDQENLWLRIDTGPEARDLPGDHCYVEVYLSGAGSMPANVYTRKDGEGDRQIFGFGIARRLRFGYHGKMTVFSLYDADGAGGWTNRRTLPTWCSRFVEMKIPLEQLGLRTGDNLRMVAVGYCDHKVIDTIPNSGPVSVRIPPMGDQGPLKALTDPVGDDHGPGTYAYPTDPVFVEGAFDLTSLEVMLDGEENVIFKLGVAGGLDPVWGGVAGYSLQAIDIYIDTDGVADSGQRDLFRARKARTVADHAWEYFVRACMDTIAIYDATGTKLAQSGVKTYPDKASSSLFVTFPRSTISGGDHWNVIVAMLGHDGYSDGQIRPVLATAEQWYFGGCADETLCPAIVDLIVEDGPSQEEQLSAYKRTGSLPEITGISVEFP
jgi:hypothetical protein